jgi:pentachlorophenol monooxygenase
MKKATDVLVVGAGPVGLLSAYCLCKAGADVTIVDDNERNQAQSFAVVVHPRTVGLLTDLGITAPLVWQGSSFERLLLFSEGEQRATLDIPAPNELAHGGLTLPQSALRRALEAALHDAGVRVEYRYRLDSLSQRPDGVSVRLVSRPEDSKVGGASTEIDVEARFVVGADGRESSVRSALGIARIEHAPPDTFLFFDVRSDRPQRKEATLVIDELSSAIYPLHDGSVRFAFQVREAPSHPPGRAELYELRKVRMAWEHADHERIEWTGTHTFVRAAVESFGKGRVWLAGDAAHTSSPLGAQSLNVGLREGRDLARAINECLEGRSLDHLQSGYGAQRRMEWERLMGLDPPSVRRDAPDWAKRNLQRLVSSLPASSDDLDDLLAQLGITLP